MTIPRYFGNGHWIPKWIRLLASTKSHASGKIKNRSFRILRMGSNVFFDADSESPHMT